MSELDRQLQLALQAAVREALESRHAYLTVEHILYALLHDERGAEVLRAVGIDLEMLKTALLHFFDAEVEKLPPQGELQTEQTLAFHRVVQHALQHAQSAEKTSVDAGDLLAAIFQEPDSHAAALLHGFGVNRLDVLRYITHGVSKAPAPSLSGAAPGGRAEPVRGGEAEPAADPLAAYVTNLSQRAARGELDPVVGREAELTRALHILARRRKNNPIFIGETGVGKTALAEGLAQRICDGDVPPDLAQAEIFALDLGALLAGTRYRGDFEARFKALAQAILERPQPVLFIDEIHSLLGAGAAQGGAVDASNLLKPLLASGQLRCLGSTTYDEFRHFERDRALARRFQRVDVSEPSVEQTLAILEGLAPRYEKHHGVRFPKPVLRAAVELAARYVTDRFLPDKAIDVVDEVGAALRLARQQRRRKVASVRDVEEVVARMARVPLARIEKADRAQLENLGAALRAVVFGQDAAVESVVRAIKRARAGLSGVQRPTGSFLFTGPTGVGKTEIALQLAKQLGVPFLRFDMSEYMEKHAVARLIGAPPGYVGYDEGGLLVERVRKQPHAVLLLDEIEKAHSDLFDILLQVMDRAVLTDNHGREADFRNIILVMTSNAGAREMAASAIGFGGGAKGDGQRAVEKLFSPEFRNRLDEVVRFEPLAPESVRRVVDKFVREVEVQLSERKVEIVLSDAARDWLATRGYDERYGARPLLRVIQSELKDRLADEVLFGRLRDGGRVRIDAAGDAIRFEFA